MTRPRLLDLFCGAGGAAAGYAQAGFEVTGVDIVPQPNFAGSGAVEFFQADVIHASPPCQAYSGAYKGLAARVAAIPNHPRLIATTRALLLQAGRPYVIENVVGARRELHGGLLLCAQMFRDGRAGTALHTAGPLIRHRLFESSLFLWTPAHPPCKNLPDPARDRLAGTSAARRAVSITGHPHYAGAKEDWKRWMGTPWMVKVREITEAIPPAYTEWIGRQLIQGTDEAVAP